MFNLKIRRALLNNLTDRDTDCIAKGDGCFAVAAQIIPLDQYELIPYDLIFSRRNGVLLEQDLEEDYYRQKWIFDYDGTVTVLYPKWAHKDTIRHVKISKDPDTGPSKELIELHNLMALEEAKHHCPNCWKCVGAVNIKDHTAAGCCESDEEKSAGSDAENNSDDQ